MKTIELEKTFQTDKDTFMNYLGKIYSLYVMQDETLNYLCPKISFSSVIHCECYESMCYSKKILKFKTNQKKLHCKIVLKKNDKQTSSGLCKNHVEENKYDSLLELEKSGFLEKCLITAVFIKKKLTFQIDNYLRVSFDELQTYPDKQRFYYIEVEGEKEERILNFCDFHGLDKLKLITKSKFSNCKRLQIEACTSDSIKQLLSTLLPYDFNPSFEKFCPPKSKMNVEREIKISSMNLADDEQNTIELLRERFTVLPDLTLNKTDYYYDTENNDLKRQGASYRIRSDGEIGSINFKLVVPSKNFYIIRNEHISKFKVSSLEEILEKKCPANNHLSHYLQQIGVDAQRLSEKLLLKSTRKVYLVYMDSIPAPQSLIGLLFFDHMQAKKPKSTEYIDFSMIEFEFYDSYLSVLKIQQQHYVEELLQSVGPPVKESKYALALKMLE